MEMNRSAFIRLARTVRWFNPEYPFNSVTMRVVERKPLRKSSSLTRCASFKLKSYSGMPRALVAPKLAALCPTSSTIPIASGGLEAQLAPCANGTCNANEATINATNQAIGLVAFFTMLSISINSDAHTTRHALTLSILHGNCLRRTPLQQVAFALVAREPRCRFERGARLFKAAEFLQQVAADACQEMISLQRRLVRKAVHEDERRCRALGHADRHRAVELDNRRAHEFCELCIKSR